MARREMGRSVVRYRSVHINEIVRCEQNAAEALPSVEFRDSLKLLAETFNISQPRVQFAGRWLPVQDCPISALHPPRWFYFPLRQRLRQVQRALADEIAIHHEERLRSDIGQRAFPADRSGIAKIEQVQQRGKVRPAQR